MSTHVGFQITRLSKTLLAHITLVRFLVRVSTHVVSQTISSTKTLLAHIALVLPSLPLHSFSKNSSFFFPHLMILFHTIVTRHAHEHPPQSFHVFVVSLFFSRTTTRFRNHHHRLYVFRALRMFILPSAIRHRSGIVVVFFFLFRFGKMKHSSESEISPILRFILSPEVAPALAIPSPPATVPTQ